MKRIVAVFFLVFFVVLGHGQTFKLTADAKKVVQNSSFQIKYTLDGAKGTGFNVSGFGKLEVVGGPSQSSQMSVINGRVSQSQSFSYSLFVDKVGTYKIPAASIVVNGKRIKSNGLSIEVVKGQPVGKVAAGEGDSYVKMETTATEAILGQQITIEYKLYTRQDVNGYDLLNESDYDGFFSQELRNYRAEVTREIVDGKEYYTKVLKKVALFPQRTGRFDFKPVTVTLAIPIPGAKKSRGFFSSTPTRNKRVQTNPLTIQVNDPPANAPVSFSGAVGKYVMKPTINKTKITTDDAFVINMEVRGTGDGKTFSAPNQPIVKDIEYYDPNVVRDEDTSRDGIVSNYKQIEYLLVPKKPGRYTLRPEFTYYDTDSSAYVTLAPTTFRVQVSKGSRSVTEDDREVSIAQSLMKDRLDSGSYSSFSLKYFDPFWFVSMFLGIAALIWMMWKKKKMDDLENLDPEEKRRRKALKLASEKLEKARTHQEAGDDRKFYEEVSSTMNGYLGNKFGLPNSDFQKDKIIAKFKENAIDDESIHDYLSILKTCEMALFAGQPSSKMEELLSKCTKLILSLEK